MENINQDEIIYELLSKGIWKKGRLDNLHDIKATLRQIHFDVVEWYDKSCYILTSTGNKKYMVLGYNEQDNKEIIKVFEAIIQGREVQSDIINSLIHNEWLEEDNDGKYKLSKKTCVIFKDIILEENGLYKSCKICSFLVYKSDMHEYCSEILTEKGQV